MPWGDLEPAYNAVMNMGEARPSKPARLVIGAMIIKHKLNLSDEETVLQIQENAYLQYFCGHETYIDALPFVPNLFVEIRKRMGTDMFENFEQAIVDQAVSIQKRKQATAKNNDAKKNPPASPPTDDTATETIPASTESDNSNEVTHHGRSLMDATVADQMIRFPTDVSLLNQAREITETLIDELHKRKEINGKKPRTCVDQAVLFIVTRAMPPRIITLVSARRSVIGSCINITPPAAASSGTDNCTVAAEAALILLRT